jgi:hypothetical protein
MFVLAIFSSSDVVMNQVFRVSRYLENIVNGCRFVTLERQLFIAFVLVFTSSLQFPLNFCFFCISFIQSGFEYVPLFVRLLVNNM